MKTFTKVMLILSGVLATVGLICIVVAFGMGLTTDKLGQMVEDGRFSFDAGDFSGETQDYEITDSCKGLDIEFGAGVLELRYEDVECIQVQQTNLPDLKMSVKNDCLIIREGNEINVGVNDVEDRSLVIKIPIGTKFEEVDLEIGASVAEIEDVLADELSITVGAGQANISKITATQFDLEVGAGEATAVLLEVDNLDVEAGVGQVNIGLNGVQEDYNYSIECGIGSVEVGDASYGGLGAEQNIRKEGATKEIHVECGIGEVRIKFKE